MMDQQVLLGVAAVVATLLGSLGVVGQILVARRQVNLEEANAYRDQAKAWRELRPDWERLLAAGLGPTRAGQRGVPTNCCDEYARLLEACRGARVAAQQAFDSGYEATRQSDLWDLERETFAKLAPIEGAIRQVLIHFAQSSDLIIRRRLSISAVYDALGHDVLREREAVEAVTRHAYDFGGCVAPAFEEGRWWADLTADEISPRIGWARALESSPATLSRIDVFLDYLAMRAEAIGDGVHAVTSDQQLRQVGGRRELAVRWRVLRRAGLLPALRFCWRAAWVHQRVRQPRAFPLATLLRPSLYGLGRLPRTALSWTCRPLIVLGKVLAAAAMSKRASDAERWIPRIDADSELSATEITV